MKKIFLTAGLMAVAASFAGCIGIEVNGQRANFRNKIIKASATTATHTLDNPAAFSKIVVSGVGDVEYRQSTDGTSSVSISCPDNLFDIVEVYSEGGTLTVKTKPGYTITGLGDRDIDIRATSPALNAVRVSGAGDISIEGKLNTDAFEVRVSGAGDIDIDNLECRSVEVGVTGAGDVDIERGTAGRAKYTISGAGDIDAGNLRARSVDVRVSGAGDVECYASESISASVSGVGSVFYSGNPAKVDKSKSGIGSIRAR